MTKHFIIAVVIFFYIGTAGQESAEVKAPEKNTFLLPDGKILKNEKLDSLENAWGEGRVIFMHNEEDDKKGIIHLLRKTDEMDRKYKEMDAERKNIFTAMFNKPAPVFALTDLHGKRWSLEELRGKVVVLNFWFTSCAPCIQEMPGLNALVQDYKGKDVVFLALTYNTREQVTSFLRKRSFDYTLLPDSKDVDKKYNVSSWPTSIVIDKKGIVNM